MTRQTLLNIWGQEVKGHRSRRSLIYKNMLFIHCASNKIMGTVFKAKYVIF